MNRATEKQDAALRVGPRSPVWVGVDGGGSKTEAWVATGEGSSVDGLKVLGRGLAAASNLKQVGLTQAVQRIVQAVSLACENAGLARCVIARAHVGLAGAGHAAERIRVEAELGATGLALSWGASDDVSPVLAAGRALDVMEGGEPCDSAVVLVSGTGSMAWGTHGGARTARAGGLGPIFGDEGSGYDIGRAAIRLACRVVESRAEPTALLGCVLGHLGLDSGEDLLDWCRGGDPPRRTVAGLAQPVIESSETDPQAKAMVRQAVEDLAGLAASVRARLAGDSPGQWLLVMTGGVLVHQELIRKGVVQTLSARKDPPARCVVVPHPVLGSLLTAARSNEPGVTDPA